MQTYTTRKRVTLIASTERLMCPRASITGDAVLIADDYSGKIRTNRKLLSKLF